jgi:hypothetical protein
MKHILNKIFFILIFASIILAACKNEKRNCDPALLVPAFIGKTAGDLRDFTIYRYPADSFPNAMIDSLDVHEGVGITFQVNGDTVRLFPRTNAFLIKSGYDYLIKLEYATGAGGNASLIFRNIRDDEKTIRCKTEFGKDKEDCSCMSRLLACTINDSLYTGFKLVSDHQGDFREGHEILIGP